MSPGGLSNRLFSPVTPTVVRAALQCGARAVPRASVACQAESHSGLRWGQRRGVTPIYRVACVPLLVLRVCQQPIAEGVSCGGGQGWVGRTALNFHCGCWHQAEQRSLGQRPWSFSEQLPDWAALRHLGSPFKWPFSQW